MDQNVANVLMSQNIIPIAISIILIIVLLGFLARKGLFSFKGKGVKIGNQNFDESLTREVIRRQMEYAKNKVQEFTALIPRGENFNEYRAKYAAIKVYVEMINWIAINHVKDDEFYIANKQTIIWNILQGIEQKPEYKSQEFRKTCNDAVEEIIKQLVKIKEYYYNEMSN